jgi:Ca2+-binding EF-hand superfamily protein
MTKPSPLLLTVALALATGACSTSPYGSLPETDGVFLVAAGSWDRDKDGVVTCEEWKAYATELFNGGDANRDEALAPAEYATLSVNDKMFERLRFEYWDANRDGRITRAEFIDKPNPAFVLLDKTNDCRLTATELTGGRSIMVEPPPESKDDQKMPGTNKRR